jgi:hypothetical protein
MPGTPLPVSLPMTMPDTLVAAKVGVALDATGSANPRRTNIADAARVRLLGFIFSRAPGEV